MASFPAKLLRRFAFAAGALALAAPLWADPVTLSNGVVETELGIGAARFQLEGESFFWASSGDFQSPLALCLPCPEGTRTTFSGRLGLSNRGGTLIRNGDTYSDVSFTGTGTFVTSPVVISGTGAFSLQTPFLFQGSFDVFSTSDPFTRLFALNLAGSGTAIGSFMEAPQLGEGLISVLGEGLRYNFEDLQTSPVPEPTSLLLVSTGVGGLMLRCWRARRRQ
jgi:hypothetical protein